jgi:CHC2-type zinc finger protein
VVRPVNTVPHERTNYKAELASKYRGSGSDKEQLIIDAIEAVIAERGGHQVGDQICFLCPVHDERTASAYWNPAKLVWHCFGCRAGGGYKDLAEHLGEELTEHLGKPLARYLGVYPYPLRNRATVQPTSSDGVHIVQKRESKRLHPSKQPAATAKGLTLGEYSRAKQLPEDFLRSVGVTEVERDNHPALRMEYPNAEGKIAAIRYRHALDGEGRFKWRKGDKPLLYGLNRLKGNEDYVLLVEGESDCHTCWYNNVPALGLPGSGLWDEERDAPVLDRFQTVYAVYERDGGANTLVSHVHESRIRDKTRVLDLNPFKDPSEMYMADPEGFEERMFNAMDKSAPLSDFVHQQRVDLQWDMCHELAKEKDILRVLTRQGAPPLEIPVYE